MLTDFFKNAVSAWHGVGEVKKLLDQAGFQLLNEEDSWELEPGRGYYVIKNGRSLAAFRVGSADIPRFNIIAAHTDSPHLRLKKESLRREGAFLTGGVSVYGGPILSTWQDRPLGLAGSVLVPGAKGRPERLLFRSDEPVGIIPNAAIHLNREINKGYEIKPGVHLPVTLTLNTDLYDYIAEKLSIDRDSILSSQMELYLAGEPVLMGSGDTALLSSSRIDNLVHCLLAAEALAVSTPAEATPIALLFDSEETGSRTAEGALSGLTEHLMERICLARGLGRETLHRSRPLSYIISADVAHGWNGNYGDKYDPAYRCDINGGPVIKIDNNNKYATTGETEARLKLLARESGIPLQTYIHHSDLPCGSTVGPLLSAATTIPCLDMGLPIWAMHSIRETAGIRDIDYTRDLFKAFYKEG